MRKSWRAWLRGTATIGVVGVAAVSLLVGPAGAHIDGWPHLKKHIKKIATKIAKKEATTIVQTTVGPTIFIEETELDRFGQVKLSLGGSQAIGTYGPFTLTARCEDADPTAGTDIGAFIEITTSEANSILYTDDWGSEDDFDPADSNGPIWWAGADSSGYSVGDPQAGWSDETEGHASAPSGVSIDGRTEVNFNFAGSPCVFSGYVIQTAPSA